MNISLAVVQQSLRLGDIEGLLSLGAPDDEYSYEAESISTALTELNEDDLTEGKLTEIIGHVWTHSFGPFSDAELKKRSVAFRQVAHEIQSRVFASATAAGIRSR